VTRVSLDEGQSGTSVLPSETAPGHLDHPERQVDPHEGAIGTDLLGECREGVPGADTDLEDALTGPGVQHAQSSSARRAFEWRLGQVVPRC